MIKNSEWIIGLTTATIATSENKIKYLQKNSTLLVLN